MRTCRHATTGGTLLTETCGVPVCRADIVACYRLILGGEPENETAIAWYRKNCTNLPELRHTLSKSCPLGFPPRARPHRRVPRRLRRRR
jgi:hypothetical protein